MTRTLHLGGLSLPLVCTSMVTFAWTFCVLLGFPARSSAETVRLYFDPATPQIAFAAGDIKAALEKQKHTVQTQNLSTLAKDAAGKKIVLALATDKIAATIFSAHGGKPVASLGAQAYALRTITKPDLSSWVLGGDAVGVMYVGLHLGEIVAACALTDVADGDHSPYIAQRGIKFNIPLDKRQPSFDDNGTSGQENFQHVWDLAFWKDYLDTIARQRYNVLSLWNRHPFPTLVKVPGYEGVALDDVYNKKGQLIRKMPHADKVKFWNDVIAYAADRGIDVWWYVWNIHVYGSEESKYGLTDSPDNATTKDYIRK